MMNPYVFTMPIMQGIQIPTKGKSFLARAWALFTVIRKWRIAESWLYRLPNGVFILIPKTFIFDGASIPRIFWALLSPNGLLLVQGLVHDFGYRFDYLWCIDPVTGVISKYKVGAGQKYWDFLFLEVGKDINGMIGVDTFAWLTLRLFGCFAWRKNRKENQEDIYPHTVFQLS